MGLVNQNTPYGSTTYNATGSYTTPAGETVPTYTQNTQLGPLGQSILTGQQNVANTLIPTAQNLAGQIGQSTSKPIDYNLNINTPFSSYLNQGPQQLDTNATNAIYNQQKSFLDPQWNNQQQQLTDQLSRQGIPVGSDAYNNAMTQLNNSRTQAYQSAQDSAITGGSAAASNLFGLAQAGQNQNVQQQMQQIQEQQAGQQQPISLLSQLFGASPSTPTQPIGTTTQAGVSPVDVTGATAASNNAAMQAYQAQIAQNNATTGGIAGTLGTLAIAGATAY